LSILASLSIYWALQTTKECFTFNYNPLLVENHRKEMWICAEGIATGFGERQNSCLFLLQAQPSIGVWR
jgi:hypothetical protein